jgi:protein phosphatase
VDLGALSHPGKVRPNNEDHYLVLRSSRAMVTLMTNLPDGQVPERFEQTGYALVVADGMGGMAAGELASSLALSIGLNLALDDPKWSLRITEKEVRERLETFRRRVRQIDYLVTERARADPALTGMGTTLTGAYSIGADLFLFHVGDSRVYLFRGGKLLRLTSDHTLAQALADAGHITPQEVPTHRLRHVLTRAVGVHGGQVEAEIQHLPLADGDRVLLCTDGLTEMATEDEIADVLRRVEPSAEACRALVDLALEGGGRDNVTVALARYSITETPAPDSPPPAAPPSE